MTRFFALGLLSALLAIPVAGGKVNACIAEGNPVFAISNGKSAALPLPSLANASTAFHALMYSGCSSCTAGAPSPPSGRGWDFEE